MKAKEFENRKGDADVFYMVDPQKLSIKLCYTSAKMKKVEYATTFENFTLEERTVTPQISERIKHFPTCIDGIFYFRSEDEALDFVRKQIGL